MGLRLHRLRHRHRIRQGGREPRHHRPQCQEAGSSQAGAGKPLRHQGADRAGRCLRGRRQRGHRGKCGQAGRRYLRRIQVLINNAQASASGVPLAEHTTEQFDLAIYSGLYAAFYYMKACYPYLAESHGSVINFASGAGLFGNFGQSAYAAAKEGIRGMSRVAATEWAKTASTSTWSARWHGRPSSSSSGTPTPTLSRPTSRCPPWPLRQR
mgnify:CR=1 FL=1